MNIIQNLVLNLGDWTELHGICVLKCAPKVSKRKTRLISLVGCIIQLSPHFLPYVSFLYSLLQLCKCTNMGGQQELAPIQIFMVLQRQVADFIKKMQNVRKTRQLFSMSTDILVCIWLWSTKKSYRWYNLGEAKFHIWIFSTKEIQMDLNNKWPNKSKIS